MAITVPSVTGLPTPPSKADPNNFAVRADAFLSALEVFGRELNASISGLNLITSGLDQATPIAAYNAGTTYDFPDVVAGSDGYSYRCVGTSVVGVDPTADDGTNWVKMATPLASETEALAGTETAKAVSPATALAMIRAKALPSPPSGVDVTGGVFGFNLSKTGANQVTVSKGSCLDSTLTVPLALTADTAVAIPAVANTCYHIFVVKLTGGTFEVRTYTTEAGVASDGAVSSWRWVGFVITNSSAQVPNFAFYDDTFEYLDMPGLAVFSGSDISATPFLLNYSAAGIPTSRVWAVALWGQSTVSANDLLVHASPNGTQGTLPVLRVAGSSSTDGYYSGQHPPVFIPLNMKVCCTDLDRDTGEITVVRIKLKR